MILEIGKVVYSLLTQDSNLKKKIGKKVFPLVADSDTTSPFITYKRSSIDTYDNKDNVNVNQETVIEVSVVSEKYNNSIDIAKDVKNALHGKRGMIAGIKVRNIYLIDASEDYINDAFVQNLSFKVKI